MRTNYFLFGLLIITIACGAWITRARATEEKTVWEYRTLYGNVGQAPGLNTAGAEGWELTAIACQENNPCAFYQKRRK